MCGFLVQFSQKDDDFNNFEIANDLLDKRGPDSTGYYKDSQNHKFGFER